MYRKKRHCIRPLVAGLSLALAGGAAMADGKGQMRGGEHMGGKPGWGHSQKSHHKARGMHMGQGMSLELPGQVLDKLKLNDAQKAKYFDAQSTSRGMREASRQNMRESRQAYRDAQGDYDPRKIFEQQNKRMSDYQKARETVQKAWLGFWDSLDDGQKDVVKEYHKLRSEAASEWHRKRGERGGHHHRGEGRPGQGPQATDK